MSEIFNINTLKSSEINNAITADKVHKTKAMKFLMIKNCISKCSQFQDIKITKEEKNCSNDCLYAHFENLKASVLE